LLGFMSDLVNDLSQSVKPFGPIRAMMMAPAQADMEIRTRADHGGLRMSLDQLISLLVAITLIEMMFATGLSVRFRDVIRAARAPRMLLGAGLANYMAVPCAAVLLTVLVDVDPMAAAGILILAACPGAPYGPSLTALAGGETATSVGLTVILAGSSMLVAPFLLSLLLPLTAQGADLHVDPSGMLGAILVTQFLPLCAGLAVNHWRPDWAESLLAPAVAVGKVLTAATLAAILTAYLPQLLDIRPGGILAMLMLLGVSLAAGWCAGGRRDEVRRAVALTTSVRNVGLGLVIAAGGFAGPSAVTAVVAYGLVQLLGSFLLALWWWQSPLLVELRSNGQAKTQ
jgi:BASS family bile acid:Na+ symporter